MQCYGLSWLRMAKTHKIRIFLVTHSQNENERQPENFQVLPLVSDTFGNHLLWLFFFFSFLNIINSRLESFKSILPQVRPRKYPQFPVSLPENFARSREF